MIFTAGEVARRRKGRGLKLKLSRSCGFDHIGPVGRDSERQNRRGDHEPGHTDSDADDVMEGVPEMIGEIQVEGTFPDGTKLVTVHQPIR